MTIRYGDFEWDEVKAQENLAKHGVTFEEASTVFDERLPEDAVGRYDWSRATRGRYAGKLKMGSAMRRLDDDLVEAFPNSKAVNDALRAVLALGNVLPALARRAGKRSAA